ncbi:MAG TPA: protein-disulfide reductase DsbD [Xanthomonadaceae bacterium]|nr:protein-disulfide reductase DsbD [Xanthomonadaceae bacterium]
MSTSSFLRRLRGGALALFALWLPTTAMAAIDPDDLLPVDQAFVLTATAPEPGRIVLRWRIADGYYLYRHRMDADVVDGDFSAGALQLPAGERHVDEFFGEVETYRDEVEAVLPGSGAGTVTLQVKYQGCADLGVCYPPQRREVTVAVPTGAAPAAGGLLQRAARPSLLGAGDEPLPEAQAFGFDAIARDADTLLLRFAPAQGYYLYRDRTSIELTGRGAEATGLSAGALQWPPGTPHEDEFFGSTIVYFEPVEVALPLHRLRAGGGELLVTASFQGCQDEGICYPPMTRTVAVRLPEGVAASVATRRASSSGTPVGATSDATEGSQDAAGNTASDSPIAADAAPTGTTTPTPQAEDQRLAAQLAGQGRGVALLLFLGAGLLLAFTPCVLPMIPILSGLIAGASAAHGGRLGTGRALALSSVYVLANALVFTAAGVVAGLLGANLQVAFQHPWVITAFAALFVALALSMFGLYELQLPPALRARLGEVADRQRGGSWPGVAAMGALSALIVGPCVAPPLAAAVLYIGQTRDPVFGGAALFALAIGMGLPLLAFGVAAGRGLPTSGPWMTAVQRVFGFVFLGLAVWMLSRILPGPASLALWGVLALGAAAWAFGLAKPDALARTRLLARFAGLALLVVGAAQLVGAWTGGNDPLRPLAAIAGEPARKLEFRMIKSVEDLDREVAAARAAGQPLLFDFYADWCVSCKEMEKYTFTEAQVHESLAGFVLLKADVTANDAIDQALMRRFGIVGPPATLFFVDGVERRDLRLYGFEDADAFSARVGRTTAAE